MKMYYVKTIEIFALDMSRIDLL